VLILTGSPDTGKTTVLSKVVSALKERGVTVGGMMSREVRESGVRVCFEISDVASGRRSWLAHVNQKTGPQVGKYRVNISALDSVRAQAIPDALEKSSVTAIDEIGPMERLSEKFKASAKKRLKAASW